MISMIKQTTVKWLARTVVPWPVPEEAKEEWKASGVEGEGGGGGEGGGEGGGGGRREAFHVLITSRQTRGHNGILCGGKVA